MWKALELDWRVHSSKEMFLFMDAPPHGRRFHNVENDQFLHEEQSMVDVLDE